MKVLLINPTAQFELRGNNPQALESSRGFSPPLGLLLLAGYLRDHVDCQIEVIDAQAEGLSFIELSEQVGAASPDVIGLTVMTHTLIDVLRCVEICAAAAPSARVVLGGPHVHLYPKETIALPNVDLVVTGEGERTFAEVVAALKEGGDLTSIPGVLMAGKTGGLPSCKMSPAPNLDELSFPARDLLHPERYDSVLLPGRPVTTMFTSRGCPFACTFCDRPHLGKKFRYRSARNILEEMGQCKQMGISDFLIYDDTFTVRKERVMELCELLASARLEVRFDIRARVDTVDEEMLEALKRAGCQGIHYGVESGRDRLLKLLKKGITVSQVRQAFRSTRKVGISTLAYFMIGLPTEELSDIHATLNLAIELDPDYLHLAILTPFPGTQIYRDGLERGLFPTDVWQQFAQHPNMGFKPPHWPERFSAQELSELLVDGYKRFYRRPRYLARRLLAVRSMDELMRKARAGARLLSMNAHRAIR